MSTLNLLMACSDEAPLFESFIATPKSEKSNIIAVALVNRGELAAEDVTEALISDGTTDPNDVVDIVRALQLSGKAFYFPKGKINGKKAKPDEKVSSQTFGLDLDPKPTGEVGIMLSFMYEYFYSTQTTKWFNWLRENKANYDLVYWTENYVHIVENKSLIFHNVGSEITGNAAEIITGGFDVKYLGDGEPVPYIGVDASKLEGYTKLTIADPTIDTDDLVKGTCSANCNVYAAVATGTLTTTLQFAVTGQTSCLTWQLHADCSKATVGGSDTAQINPITGLVTVTAQLANTRKKYRVVAISDAGVLGEYCLELVTKTA